MKAKSDPVITCTTTLRNELSAILAELTSTAARFAVVTPDVVKSRLPWRSFLSPKLVEFAPGAHVIGSVDPNSSVSPKVKRLLWRAEQVAGAPTDEVLDQLARICRGHDGSGDPLDDACVHTPTYGTRSSLLLRLARRPSERFLGYADGPPCTTAYDDLTPLLHELDRATGIGVGSATTRNAS